MVAYFCWSCLVALGFACGMATFIGLRQDKTDFSLPTVSIENRGQLTTSAAQRYLTSRASHWKDAVLTR